jgi:hypothetical protein
VGPGGARRLAEGVRHEDRKYLPLTPAVLASHLRGKVHIGLYQGGLLLTQVRRSAKPLREVTSAVIAYIETFAADPAPPDHARASKPARPAPLA